jgi:hypothetical protein
MYIPFSETHIMQMEPSEATKHARIGPEKPIDPLSLEEKILISACYRLLMINVKVQLFYHLSVNGIAN